MSFYYDEISDYDRARARDNIIVAESSSDSEEFEAPLPRKTFGRTKGMGNARHAIAKIRGKAAERRKGASSESSSESSVQAFTDTGVHALVNAV